MEDNETTIVLQDEEGNDVAFEFLDLIEYEETSYVVLFPVENADGQVVILHVVENEGEDYDSYLSVDDDTADAVYAIFKEKFKDEFNFED